MKKIVAVMCLTVQFFTPVLAKAESSAMAADILAVSLPLYAAGLSVYKEDYAGTKQFALSFGSAHAVVQGLKYVTQVKRPNYEEGDRKDSFPSGHTASAFSSAMFLHKRYGFEQAVVPYILAVTTGALRIESKHHHVSDVLGGIAVSSLCNWLLVDNISNNEAVRILFNFEGKSVYFGIYLNF